MSARRRRNRTAEILTVSVLSALFVLGGLAGMVWIAQTGAFSGPTPTPSSTPQPAPTATPDFRATRTAQDILTQIAYSVELATLAAQTMGIGGPVTGTLPEPTLFPPAPGAAPTDMSIMLPVISQANAAAATATWAAYELQIAAATIAAGGLLPPDSPIATPTPNTVNLPLVDQGGVPTPTPFVLPTDTPTIPFVPDTPTATPTLVPPTATFAPPTPTIQYSVNSLRAIIAQQEARVYVGPGSFYTQTSTLGGNYEITLFARDQSGEWLYMCCPPNSNTAGWVRSYPVRPTGNATLPAPLPTDDGNDIRWLTERGADSGLTPVPASTPIPPTDFPMARYDRANSGRVPALPRLPLAVGWPAGGQAGLAGQGFTSGAIVVGNTVLAASADGHLYSYERESGSQRWRYFVGDVIRAAPLFEGGQIYAITENGKLVALEDQGNQALLKFEVQLSAQPRGGILAAAGRLILTARAADGERLFILDRSNGAVLRNVNLGGETAQMPAVGRQLVFVAGNIIRAIDIWSGDIVWQSQESTAYTAPPLYSTPGAESLAELYAVDNQGRVTAWDANTGTQLWAAPLNGLATGMAANTGTLFVSGPGFVRAYSRARRSEGQLLWSFVSAGNVPGGPIVDDTNVLLVTDGGSFQVLNAITGAVVVGNVQSPPLSGSVAVSGPWVYAPTSAGVLFAARSTSQ